MKTSSMLLISVGLASLLGAACTESNFAGASSDKAKSSDTSTGGTDVTPEMPNPSDPNNPGGGPNGDCVTGDKIDVQYTGEVKKCIDEGKLYNFEAKTCTAMRQASFTCDFDTFFEQLARIGLQPSKLLTEGKEGVFTDPATGQQTSRKALIMGCGESADKETILLQWFFQPVETKVDCNFDPVKSSGQIITGCYGKDSGPANISDAEKAKIVLKCMNGLGG